jgi:uncharacterized protein (TIGR03085 family)
MSSLVRQRRDGLCDLLAGLSDEQWRAETLCDGWDAGDIAAHLIIREREPWTGPGLFIGGPFAALTDRRREATKAQGRDALIARLRSGPPWPLSGPLGDTQVVEDWIHEQDVRRGGADVPGPDPDARLAPLLWVAANRFATRTLALAADLVIELTDGTRSRRLRSRRALPLATSTDAPPDVVVTGTAGELLLYAAGRDRADVTISGDAAARTALTASARSL